MVEPQPEPAPSPAPTPSPTPSASAAPSISPSVGLNAAVIPTAEPISSLEFAVALALGEDADISAYTEADVAIEDLMSVLEAENAPKVIVQLGQETYAVITGYELDEQGNLISLTLTDPAGDTILGGTEGILKAWYYAPAEALATPSVTPAPSVSAEPTDVPAEPSETPAA